MKRLTLVVLLVGCGFESTPSQGPHDGSNTPEIDAGVTDPPIDSMPIDAVPIDGQACFGKDLVKLCLTTLPSQPRTLGGAMIDTGVDATCTQIVPQTGGPALCVIAATSITVSGELVAVGTRPLVLLGLDTVTIESAGTVDVSSRSVGSRKGAGANTGTCTNTTPGENDAGGGGGGGGGGFGTVGGRGGQGDHNESTRGDNTGIGGPNGAIQAAAILRGGCVGGKGGDGDAQHRGGAGGEGGGAVYVIAGRALTIAGNIFASGAGGRGTPDATGIEQGGGGGGSGGMIGLDALTIDITGRVVANGGAGGGGGGLNVGGTSGGDGTTTTWDARAIGGAAAPDNNGPGAAGAAINKTDAMTPADADGGGGGGAGGLGIVRIDGTLTNGTMISPAPILR